MPIAFLQRYILKIHLENNWILNLKNKKTRATVRKLYVKINEIAKKTRED